jgi:predicted ATPase
MGPVFGGHDPGACAYGVQGINLCLSGLTGEGKKFIEQALSLAETLKHPHTLVFVLTNVTVVDQLVGDYGSVRRVGQRVIEISEKYNFPPQRAHGLMLCGWADAMGNHSAAGLELMEAEFPRASAIGPFFRYYAALLAETRAKSEKFSDALTILRSQLVSLPEPGIGFYLPELYRLQGLCLLRLDASHEKEAITSLQMAVDIAKQQKATLLQLKAAISMAGVASSLGQPEKALEPLRELCANLPEGFDAPQLGQAKLLLSS